MNLEIKQKILQKIKDYDRIFLFRHVRNDGDCVGSTKGMKELLKASFPEKEIYLIDQGTSAYLEFMGPEDAPVEEALYADALGIVLDTASEARISNANYKLCKELIKIDHHIPLENYGDLQWVEEDRSSCCELVVDFYETFRDELVLNSTAATHLYTGMVTDTGRFKYSGLCGNTMRAAGTLLDAGVNTDLLYARLYLEAYEYLKFKAYIYDKMQMTENGVAYLFVDKAMQEKFNLTLEQASACVGTMDSIRGCISWAVFIENGDAEGSIRVRLRSRFVHINTIAEKYRGGGHACASGATVYSLEEMQALLQDTDALVKEYKQTHEDWL
ncbi:MAG: bifunctional oligoribonuclease/PAP phosphatase NrnA [Oscillospiraceae bacterium]|nr:bifunctional oligoribonuclease/PAP phosphatase NrnA [Oscillospiraceae bacterium]